MGMKYQKRALKAISQIDTVTNNATSIKANTLNSIGYTLAALDFTDSALYYYNQSLILKKKANNLYSWCNTKNNICGLMRDNSEQCIVCFEELLKVQKEINDRRGIVMTKMNLSNSYGDLGLNEKSLEEN